jgi:acyl-CoA thioester hydrolase
MRDAGLWETGPVECHVAKAEVTFRKPIRADEEIDVMARTAKIGNSSMTTLVEIHGAGAEDLRASIELVAVHVDLYDHRPRPLPDDVRTALTAFDARAA